jgi:4-amino-4-deoxy-L-arabinose transferase-like glycosyltransferase
MSETTRTTGLERSAPSGDRETRAVAATVGILVAAAAALRFWNLGGGLPSSLGVDEPQIMIRSVAMVKAGDFNPHFFDYPGLYLYVQALVVVARFLAGASSGVWSSLSQVSEFDFYLWGRAVTAAFGTATVYLLYRSGTRWGVRQGLAAAAAFAVMPIHVRESHFVLTDVPMTFFVVLAFVLSLRALEARTPAAFVWAGAAAGLAAGTKYTAWVSIVLPLVAAGFVEAAVAVRLRRALAAAAGVLAAFLLAAPYTVLDLPGFLDGFGALAAGVPARPAAMEAGWLVYLKHLRIAMGWPGLSLAGGGLAWFAWRAAAGPARARFVMVLVFVAVFWSMIIDRTLIFARYLIPALPFVCLLAAVALVTLADWARDRLRIPAVARGALVGVVAVAALAPPVSSSVAFGRQMGRRSTEAVAMDWIRENVKPGARIVHESASLHFPPNRYEVLYVRALAEQELDFYLGGNVDYVVATSANYGKPFASPGQFQREFLAYRNLFNRLLPAFTVQPSAEHPGPEVRIFAVPR